MARGTTFIDPAGALWIIDNVTRTHAYMHNAFEQIRVPLHDVLPFVRAGR